MTPVRQMNLKNGYTVEWLLDHWELGLELIENDIHEISRRLREYDPTYFLCRSRHTGRYEVHNTDNIGSTYCLTCPYPALDERLLDLVRRTDTQRIGEKARLIQLLEEEEAALKAQEKELKTQASDMAQETHYHFKEAFKLC